jgi:hypothetical protein
MILCDVSSGQVDCVFDAVWREVLSEKCHVIDG